jgi:hypothetical protein
MPLAIATRPLMWAALSLSLLLVLTGIGFDVMLV